VGHLAKTCPNKEVKNSVYPGGGCCHKCKSVEHLSKNCSASRKAAKKTAAAEKAKVEEKKKEEDMENAQGGSSSSAPAADAEPTDFDSFEPDFSMVTMPSADSDDEQRRERGLKRKARRNDKIIDKGKKKNRKW
jgi:hypothetical protein